MDFVSVARRIFFRSMFPLDRLKGPVRVILTYHAVGEQLPQSVSIDLFRGHLEMIENRFRVRRLRDLPELDSVPEQREAVLTFDDGYRSHHEIVMPLLEEYGLRGSFFVPTGLMGDSLSTWSGEVALMEPDHVQELAGRGHEVGGHAETHRKLTGLKPGVARREINRSRRTLTELCGQRVTSFAYPSGDYDESIKTMVQDAGFQRAVTVEEGIVRLNGDPLALPRIYVHRQLSPELLRAKMSWAVEWYTRLRTFIRSLL